MKSRTTLILALLALVVAGLVILDYRKGTTTADARTQGKRLLNIKADDITQVELIRTDGTNLVTKIGDLWKIKVPLAARADATAVRSLLDDLEFAERQRTLTAKDLAGVNLAEFGLESPSLRVKLQNKRGDLVTLLVGRETPTKESVYAQVVGQQGVFVTAKSIVERLNRKLDDLRDRTVVEAPPARATRLEIKSADRAIELVKTQPAPAAEARWSIVRPLVVDADQQKVRQLLEDLNNLRVVDFVSEDARNLHPYQLDEPDREIAVTVGEASKILVVGSSPTNDPTKVYAKLKESPSIFTVAADSAKRFSLQVNDLRDTRVLPFAEAEVSGLEVLRGTQKIAATRDGKGWQVSSAPGVAVAADGPRVHDLLSALQNLRVQQFVADVATDLDKYGLAAPAVTVTLQGKGTNVVGQLLVGALDQAKTSLYAKRADQPFIYGIETNALDRLPSTWLGLRTRQLAELPADRIGKLTVQKASGSVALARGPDGKWQLTEPKQGVLDNDALNRALEALTGLRAQEFLAETVDNPSAYGLDHPELTVVATVGDKSYTLKLGKAADTDHRYASWSDPSLLFTVLAIDAHELAKDLVTAPAVAPAAIVPAATNPPPAAVVAPAVPPATNAPPAAPAVAPAK